MFKLSSWGDYLIRIFGLTSRIVLPLSLVFQVFGGESSRIVGLAWLGGKDNIVRLSEKKSIKEMLEEYKDVLRCGGSDRIVGYCSTREFEQPYISCTHDFVVAGSTDDFMTPNPKLIGFLKGRGHNIVDESSTEMITHLLCEFRKMGYTLNDSLKLLFSIFYKKPLGMLLYMDSKNLIYYNDYDDTYIGFDKDIRVVIVTNSKPGIELFRYWLEGVKKIKIDTFKLKSGLFKIRTSDKIIKLVSTS